MQKLIGRVRGRSGQSVVEYLLILAVVVGVSMIVGKMFKAQIGGIFNQVIGLIGGVIASNGSPI